jgi:hypothetical protein
VVLGGAPGAGGGGEGEGEGPPDSASGGSEVGRWWWWWWGGGRDFSQREALLHVYEMLGGIDPHGLCGRRADLYVPLSNRFSFEAKLVEHSEVKQAACTTLK